MQMKVLNSELLKAKVGTLNGTSGKSSKPLQKWRKNSSSLQRASVLPATSLLELSPLFPLLPAAALLSSAPLR